jgi:hypothetical protein
MLSVINLSVVMLSVIKTECRGTPERRGINDLCWFHYFFVCENQTKQCRRV